MRHHNANIQYDLTAYRQFEAADLMGRTHLAARFVYADEMVYLIKKRERGPKTGSTRKHEMTPASPRVAHSILTPELVSDRSLS
jgi:hypothetical protein